VFGFVIISTAAQFPFLSNTDVLRTKTIYRIITNDNQQDAVYAAGWGCVYATPASGNIGGQYQKL